MEADLAIDLDLFGVLPAPAYDGLGERRAGLEGGAAPLLDTKAEAPLDPFLDMQAMLLEMTKELRERFQRAALTGLMLLLQSARAMLLASTGLDREWARTTGRQIDRQIKAETSVTRKYERLRAWMLDKTARLLAAADVRGLMRVRRDLVDRDARLERRRPAEVASLLATLDDYLDPILVAGCQRSGTTALARLLKRADGMIDHAFGHDDELDGALLLAGYATRGTDGRHCFQTRYCASPSASMVRVGAVWKTFWRQSSSRSTSSVAPTLKISTPFSRAMSAIESSCSAGRSASR